MADDFLSLMLNLTRQGGEIATGLIHNSRPGVKPDKSVITQADKDISALVQRELKAYVDGGAHIIIDEEDPRHGEYLNGEALDRAAYIWALDPIDGTRPYANRMPFYGISLGVLKHRRPWLGAVYFPSLNELFYTDGSAAYFVQGAFSQHETKTRIVPVDEEVNRQSIFLCSDSFFTRFNWDFKACHLIIPACAVIDLCWPSIGRGCGSLIRCSLWDYAASWAIARHAGLELRSIESGRIMEELRLEDLQAERGSWKLKDFYILSSERNFSVLRGILKG